MPVNPHRPARQSPRLKEYDYAQDGAYFVTLCAQHRAHVFGEVVGDAMRLNAAGMMVDHWWQEIPRKFPDVELDVYVIMPNHFHAILVLNHYATTVGATLRGRPGNNFNETRQSKPVFANDKNGIKTGEGTQAVPYDERAIKSGEGTQALPYTVPDIIGWFKTMTTNAYIHGVNEQGWEPFNGKLWQRSFHDHIIRGERELNVLREYIVSNPALWAADQYYAAES